jgi:hypothetical protein
MIASNNSTSKRQFSFEGAVHLFSSPPAVLMPADIHTTRQNSYLMEMLETANIYLITLRRRIYLEAAPLKKIGNTLAGMFLTPGPEGPQRTPFVWPINGLSEDEHLTAAHVTDSCTHIQIQTNRRAFRIPAHIVLTQGQSELPAEERDLQVVYVGQGQGRTKSRNAVDRLANHKTLQRIMADILTFDPHREVLLLLYRFEHGGSMISTGGDLTLNPVATANEERDHLARLRTAKLSRKTLVTLAEAALIRHFRPLYNELIKNTAFESGKLKVLQAVLETGMSGLIVEAGSASAGGRLHSEYAQPINLSDLFSADVLTGKNLESESDRAEWAEDLHLMAHTIRAEFPLVSTEDRNNFLHGMRWNNP